MPNVLLRLLSLLVLLGYFASPPLPHGTSGSTQGLRLLTGENGMIIDPNGGDKPTSNPITIDTPNNQGG
jgi:hypothetical protein